MPKYLDLGYKEEEEPEYFPDRMFQTEMRSDFFTVGTGLQNMF